MPPPFKKPTPGGTYGTGPSHHRVRKSPQSKKSSRRSEAQDKRHKAQVARGVKGAHPDEPDLHPDVPRRQGWMGAEPDISPTRRDLYSLIKGSSKNPRIKSMGAKQAAIRKVEGKRSKAAQSLLKEMRKSMPYSTGIAEDQVKWARGQRSKKK